MWQIDKFLKEDGGIRVVYTRIVKSEADKEIKEEKELRWDFDVNKFKDYGSFEDAVEREANLMLEFL